MESKNKMEEEYPCVVISSFFYTEWKKVFITYRNRKEMSNYDIL